MKAVVFHAIGDIRLDDIPEPVLQQPTDAIVRLTTSAICGTDLHFVRGTFSGMKPGTVLGHEGVGVIEQLGDIVRGFDVGDRVVICSTMSCGWCSYCRAGWFSQCDNANPGGASAGTAFFGGPEAAGAIDGLQAERARIPFATSTLVKLPDDVSDEQAILLSDIMPTGWFGADIADIEDGHTVAVFGCGPVGCSAIIAAKYMGGRVIAVDCEPDRLALARRLGAETINFEQEDPIEMIKALTGGIGADRVIDAVGVDAVHAHAGPAADKAEQQGEVEAFEQEQQQIAPEQNPRADGTFTPGDAPSQVLKWALDSIAKGGLLSIIGVYPPTAKTFPIGEAMNKNLTIKMGNCPHRKYVPHLVDMVAARQIDPLSILSHGQPLTDAISAYESFDRREDGWTKVELVLQAAE
jgi:threonine dehydrogenase-like Zn-dependent dehydrogenase